MAATTRVPLNDAAQKQALALAAAKDNGAQLYARFMPVVVELLTAGNASDDAPELLHSAFKTRLDARVRAGLIATKKKDKRLDAAPVSKDAQKQYAVFAAKLAQSVIKTYAAVAVGQGATDADKKHNQDILAALDVATAALYIVYSFESVLRLGDFVLDNMLYQVSKKYADMPHARSSSFYTLACLHLRLWKLHETLHGSSKLHPDCKEYLFVPESKLSPTNFHHTADFPLSQDFHTLQFSRLLVGVLNNCVTVLMQAKQYSMIVSIATTSLRAWIDHVAQIPGADPKLASSFNDRIFRLLWKCATAVETGRVPHKSLQVRSLALSFMIKCPNYTQLYLIQQVYRVGVQYERASNRTLSDYQHIYVFYISSLKLLKQNSPSSSHIFKSKNLEWDFVLWLEHTASVCENADRRMDGVLILDCALAYLDTFSADGKGVRSYLLHLMASSFLDLPSSKRKENSLNEVETSATSVEAILPPKRANEIVRSVFESYGTDKMLKTCETAATHHLKEISQLAASAFISQQPQKNYVQFVIRCVKKSVTKMYNHTVTNKLLDKPELRSLIITSLTKICEGIELIRGTAIGSSNSETLLLNESRIHRMVVTLTVHGNRESTNEGGKDQLELISKHVTLVRRLLDDAMEDDSHGSVLQGLLGDINLIARECYNYATYHYKKQDVGSTKLALAEAFGLAESYMECVMCSTKLSATDVQNAHSELKVDSIASLMAYCLREEGDVTNSRIFVGHSILYCGDVYFHVPLQNTGKYASAIFEELLHGEPDRCKNQTLSQNVREFVESVIHAYTARQVPARQVIGTIQGFRRAFDQVATKFMEKLRNKTCSTVGGSSTNDESITEGIKFCVETELFLVNSVLTYEGNSDQADRHAALMSVCKALADRRQCYASYYASHDNVNAVDELAQCHSLLSDVISSSLMKKDELGAIDVGGACGWRGVITMEIVLLASYSEGCSPSTEKPTFAQFTEESAIRDVENCLRYLDTAHSSDINISGSLFDDYHLVCCLEAICSSLSLISCPYLEKSARKLLERFQSAVDQDTNVLVAWPPPSLESLNFHIEEKYGEICAEDMDIDLCENDADTIPHFQQIDAEITFGVKSQSKNDLPKTLHHLQTVVKMLKLVKSSGTTGFVSKSAALKAICMRELLVHLILSEIHFSEGHGDLAISEAKTALSICWKLSKKFVSSPKLGKDCHFELPQSIKRGSGLESGRISSLIYFQALEFSSWDILHATKLVLCRVASLYSLTGKPHRSHLYYAEAMELVGGLHLRFFQHSPFYEFARLQLHSFHPGHAKTALQVISSVHGPFSHDENCRTSGADVSKEGHVCIVSDSTYVEQYCNQIIQEGDLSLIEGDSKTALGAYLSALKLLESNAKTKLSSIGLRKARARCYRKILLLKSKGVDLGDAHAVEKLLSIMKRLEQATERCDNLLERVKCFHGLAQANMLLLRSSQPEALMSIKQTVSLLEEAFARGNHLGVSHLSKQLRSCLGMAYLMEVEEDEGDDKARRIESDEAEFLAWASVALISNSGVVEFAGDSVPSENLPDLELEKRLENLSSSQDTKCSAKPREKQREMVGAVVNQVRNLPASWLVASISVNALSELVVSRISNDGKNPVSFCLRGFHWEKTMKEVAAIIQSSRDSLSGHSADEAGSWTSEQKKQWWNKRKELDEKLGSTIGHFQRKLGFWRCLLARRTENFSRRCAQRCWTLLTHSSNVTRRSTVRYEALLHSMVDSQGYLSDAEITDGLTYITKEMDMPLSNSVVRQILHLLRQESRSAIVTTNQDSSARDSASCDSAASPLLTLTRDGINKMKVGELKDYLIGAGLNPDGIKKVLVDKVIAARDAALAQSLSSPTTDSDAFGASTLETELQSKLATILILDHTVQEFPWEGLDIMESCDSVTRMPSLDLVLRTFGQIKPGDLKATEKHLGPVLEKGKTRFGWQGIVGRAPELEEMRAYLLQSDLFIYCGHGSGEKYIHRDKILELKDGCSAALLFGCSSGRLEREGIFGPDGAVLSYLRAGSPAVLAMLWDVTDKDIDQLSAKVLQNWLFDDSEDDMSLLNEKRHRGIPLARVLQQARQVCKLKYLNGYAAVCYGLPLYVAA